MVLSMSIDVSYRFMTYRVGVIEVRLQRFYRFVVLIEKLGVKVIITAKESAIEMIEASF